VEIRGFSLMSPDKNRAYRLDQGPEFRSSCARDPGRIWKLTSRWGQRLVTGAGGGSTTLDAGPERAARSLPASCPGNLAPRKVPPGEDLARAVRLGQVRDLPGKAAAGVPRAS
jgi:hypothetical protein